MKNEIVFVPVGVGTHCRGSTVFCLPRQDERMDVNGPENPQFVPEVDGVFGNGVGSFRGLRF